MKDIIAQRFSRVARRYTAVSPVQQQSAELLFDLVGDSLKVGAEREKPVLLDVGMGSGRLFALACERFGPGWQLRGLDFAPQMVVEAKQSWPEAELLCCDAESCSYPANSYDLVLSNFALQWCDDPVSLLQRLYCALRPGGLLAVALPVRGSLSKLSDMVFSICCKHLPLFPLPAAGTFSILPRLLQDVADVNNEELQLQLREEAFSIRYSSVFAALKAVQQAGAGTPRQDGQNAVLSFRDWQQLQENKGYFELDYQVLFIVGQRSKRG